MLLNVSDAAKLLRAPEEQVYRWIEEGELPCHWVAERPRFDRAGLLEWAVARGMPVSVESFQDSEADKVRLPGLGEALRRGGIHSLAGGLDRDSVLKQIVGLLPVPDESDREALLEVVLAREAAGSTGVGDGIAIPHVRQPVALSGAEPAIVLCFLDRPIEFRAPDSRPVHTLFFMVTPTIHGHLQLLAKIAAALHDPAFKAAVMRKGGAEEILKEAARVDAALNGKGRP